MTAKKPALSPSQTLHRVFEAMVGQELLVTDRGGGQFEVAKHEAVTELAVAARGQGCDIHFNIAGGEIRDEPRAAEIVVNGTITQRTGNSLTWRVSGLHAG